MKISSKRAVKVMIGFFAAIVICTVLSRAAASALVAQVEVENIGKGKLSYTYGGEGTVVPKKEKKVFLWEGQQIEWSAKQGSTVKKGKCLVKFRKEYLEKEIGKKKSEVRQLELQAAGQQVSARKQASVPASEAAYQTLLEARKRLESAKDKEEKESAKQEVEQAKSAYEIAKKEDAAQRTNDANAQEAAKLGAEALNVQVEDAKKELETLQSYEKAGGKIYADRDCVVLENGVQTGMVTTGTEVLVIGSGGWKLKGKIEEKDKGKILEGSEAEVRLNEGEKTNVKIESVDKESQYWYASMPELAEGENAEVFTWSTEITSQKEYEQTISILALHEDIDGPYCLIVSSKESMLGEVQVAKRVPVNVLEKDDKKAAVTSELKDTDQIISDSEKFVEGGDRVRIKE